jgi:hypothetical protein
VHTAHGSLLGEGRGGGPYSGLELGFNDQSYDLNTQGKADAKT